MRTTLLVFALAIIAAMPAVGAERVTIAGYLVYADGTPAQGTFSISYNAFVVDGEIVPRGDIVVTIGTSGSYEVQLWPSPEGTQYTVKYLLDRTRYTEYWQVPESGPVTIGDIASITSAAPLTYLVSTVPTAAYIPRADGDGHIDIGWLEPCSTVGYVWAWNGTTMACSAQSGSGGGTTYTFSSPLVESEGTVSLPSFPWGSLTGVPSSFTPSAHAASHAAAGGDALTLSISQTTGLQTALDGKLGTSAQAADSALLGGQLPAYYQVALGFTAVPTTRTVAGHALSGDVTLSASDVGLGNVPNYGVASQGEAEAGTATNKLMTPERTAQAIAALGGAGAANYSQDFTSQTSVTLTHNLDSLNVLVACYDADDSIIGAGVSITDADNVGVSFTSSQTGRCVVNASGGGGGGGTGTPDGDDGDIQINSSGAFAGIPLGSGLTHNTKTELSIDPATVPAFLTGTASLDFGSIGAAACAELTITVSGAIVGDAVSLGAPPAVEAGFQWSGFVSAADTVTVRLCKITTGSTDPASATWRAWVHKTF